MWKFILLDRTNRATNNECLMGRIDLQPKFMWPSLSIKKINGLLVLKRQDVVLVESVKTLHYLIPAKNLRKRRGK